MSYVPPSGQRIYESRLRRCSECHHPVTSHHWTCSRIRTRYPEAEQRIHRQLGAAWHGSYLADTDPCPTHEVRPWFDCGPCFSIADRDDYDPMEAGL